MNMRGLLSRKSILPAVLALSLCAASPALGQQDTIQIEHKRVRFEWAAADAKLMLRRFDGALRSDVGSGSTFYNWRVGAVRLGLYYQRFGLYARVVQAEGLWKNNNFPDEYVLIEPGVVGVTFLPLYTVSFSDEKVRQAMVSGKEVRGNVGFFLRFFAEAALVGKMERFSQKSQDEMPSINTRFPPLLTAGARLGYGAFALELGYTYQTKVWHDFYDLTLAPDPAGLDLTGFYAAFNLDIGATVLSGRPFRVSLKRPVLGVDMTLGDPALDNTIDAGEQIEVEVKVENTGEGAGENVRVTLSPSDSRLRVVPRERYIDRLDPNSYAIARFTIEADRGTRDAAISITASAKDGKFDDTERKTTRSLSLVGYEAPRLQILTTRLDDDREGGTFGNANGRIDPGERIEAQTLISNSGSGPAHSVSVTLVPQNAACFTNLSSESSRLTELPPSAIDTVRYRFEVSAGCDPAAAGSSITIRATETEAKYGAEADLLTTVPPPDIVDLAVPAGRQKRPDAFAVIIGVTDYSKANTHNVTYAEHDAAVMKEYFIKTFGLSPGNVLMLMDPTKSELEDYFGDETHPRGALADHLGPEIKSLYLYYSGHGCIDPDGGACYLIPCDGSISNLSGRAYPRDLLYRNLSELNVDRILVFLETCFSGDSQRGPLTPSSSGIRKIHKDSVDVGVTTVDSTIADTLKIDSTAITTVDSTAVKAASADTAVIASPAVTPPAIAPVMKTPPLPSAPLDAFYAKAVVFAASGSDEVAGWYEEKHHGLFTYALLKGLSGEADLQRDKKITVGELRQYLLSTENGVPSYAWSFWKRPQHPEIRSFDDNLVVVELK
jgi:hypothetical protein